MRSFSPPPTGPAWRGGSPIGTSPPSTRRRAWLDNVDVQLLISQPDLDLSSRYPEPDVLVFSLESADIEEGVGALPMAELDGEPVGCGAYRVFDDQPGPTEIKRMYVALAGRGKKIRSALLAELERVATAAGVLRLALEGDAPAPIGAGASPSCLLPHTRRAFGPWFGHALQAQCAGVGTNGNRMSTFLTSQEIQDLINVDRSTVYRMAEDGRLPGVKIGRQWRFPADRVAAQLGLAGGVDRAPSASGAGDDQDQPDGLVELLKPGDAQSITDLIGELFGVMAVMTDMDGHPITSVSNPCGYFTAVADQPSAVAACLAQWRMFADEPHVAARWVRTHLGFLCARTFLWVALKPVGMIVVGGVTPASWPPDREFVESIADEVGASRQVLLDRVHETWSLDHDQQRRVLRLLPQLGDFVSQMIAAHRRVPDRSDRVFTLAATASFDAAGTSQADQYTSPQGGDRS